MRAAKRPKLGRLANRWLEYSNIPEVKQHQRKNGRGGEGEQRKTKNARSYAIDLSVSQVTLKTNGMIEPCEVAQATTPSQTAANKNYKRLGRSSNDYGSKRNKSFQHKPIKKQRS